MSSDLDPADEISPDLVFELLSSARRRMVLCYLRQHDGVATVNELAEQVAAMENDVPISDLTRRQEKRVYVSLYQTHLPKFAEANIVEYDSDAGEVRLTDRARHIETYLPSLSHEGYPWPLHYLGLALLGGLVFLSSSLGIPGVTTVPPLWLGLVIAASFAVSSIAHYRAARHRGTPLEAGLACPDIRTDGEDPE